MRGVYLIVLSVIAAAFPVLLAGPVRAVDDDTRGKLVVLPTRVSSPADNPMTPEKVELGKQLFFDPRLSGDNTMSCATCHLPEKAFVDGLAQAKGREGRTLRRNTPTIWNIGHLSPLFWDGRSQTLEEQALVPIEAADEMNQDLDELERELAAVAGYVEQFRRVFNSPVRRGEIAKAIAAFERSVVTGPSPLDQYLAGDKTALSDEAKRGLELFQGSAGCIRCHHGPMLTDGQFYRLGVSSADNGVADWSQNGDDKGRFRTPPLRDIGKTAPYMHDGSMATLFDVVDFYYRQVPPKTADGLDVDVKTLQSSSFSEIFDMVAFLESLSGTAPEIKAPRLP